MWDKRYSSESYVYGKRPNDFLLENAATLKVGRTLCLGEGEGRNAVFLAKIGHQVTAVDNSRIGLEKAIKLADESDVGIKIIHSDLAEYRIKAGYWDNIVSIFCHLPESLRKQVHKQAVKGLRQGGKVILEAYTPEQLQYGTGGPKAKEMMMNLTSLKSELSGLDFLHAEEIIRDVNEGSLHNGEASVVQLIAINK
jgi:SAM-dependent methyltransferase